MGALEGEKALEDIEWEAILAPLEKLAGNKREAARCWASPERHCSIG